MGVVAPLISIRVATAVKAKFRCWERIEASKLRKKQLLTEKWVEAATSKQVENDKAPSGKNPDWRQGYGFQFWHYQQNANRGDGRDGQICLVMPGQFLAVASPRGDANGAEPPSAARAAYVPFAFAGTGRAGAVGSSVGLPCQSGAMLCPFHSSQTRLSWETSYGCAAGTLFFSPTSCVSS